MPKTNGTKRCLETIEDLQEQQLSSQLDFVYELEDDMKYTSIWKNPKRIDDPDDYCVLFNVLAREISYGNYDEPLLICRKLNSDALFSNLLVHLIREERRKKIDAHLILSWLEVGDSEISNSSIFSKKSYALLKLYYLCKNWKSKIDTFSCGCVQKITIDLFVANRLNEALHSVFKNSLQDLNITVRRLLCSFSDVSQLEFFSYYIETLQELHSCRALSEPSAPTRIIQLMGLLCELPGSDFPEACSKINRLLGHLMEHSDASRKPSPTIETVLKSKLIPKIFESLKANSEVKLESFNQKEMLQRFVALVEKENYSFAQKSIVFFAPLQLLLFICRKWDVWKRCQSVIKSKISSIDLSSSQAPVLILYTISLIFHVDSSLLEFFLEILEAQYPDSPLEVKKTILTTMDILEKLPGFSAPKSRLLLATPIDQSELVFDHIKDLSSSELNFFIKSNSTEFSSGSCYSSELFGAIVKNLDFYISSDIAWKIALQKSAEKSSIAFIASQLKILVSRKEECALKLRVSQIFEELRVAPSRELLLTFSKVLLMFSPSEYATLPPDTSKLLIPVLILSYCLYFERNEQHILKLFRSLLEKICGKENDSSSKNDPSECMEMICTWLQTTNISFLNKETFVKTLFDICKEDTRKDQNLKERCAEMSSILFGKLAAKLQEQGESAKGNFCNLANVIDKFLSSKSYGTGNEKICRRAIEGYSKMNKKWNKFFATSKVMKILIFARSSSPELLSEVLEKIRGNQDLLDALRSCKKNEFLAFDA